tara:strand:- start:189 stop:500 length:312 start_codon:yes stop_codon:yes gene_type:complete
MKEYFNAVNFKAGDTVPSDWYQITFKDGHSIEEHPDFKFTFILDCRVDVKPRGLDIYYKGEGDIMLLDSISHGIIKFSPPIYFVKEPDNLNYFSTHADYYTAR